MKYTFLIVLFSFIFIGSSCTLGSGAAQIPKKVQKKPDLLYNFGMKMMKKGQHEEARLVFKKVRTAFPISMYATLAEL
ncbi:hypothetical protein KKF84_04640, partial [Myxococcota bacterium]|nr:hypothetical protein [Myxococcota bacterium]